MMLVPGLGEAGAVGEGAAVAGRLGEAAEAAGAVGKLGEAAETAGAVGKLGEAAETAGAAGKVAEGAGALGEAAKSAEALGAEADAAGAMSRASEGAGVVKDEAGRAISDLKAGTWPPETAKYQYNMVENPGPLAEKYMYNADGTLNHSNPALNFGGGKYNVGQSSGEDVFYRMGGENSRGQWYTREQQMSEVQARSDLAIKRDWTDPRTGEITGRSPIEVQQSYKVPKGASYYEGPAGYQGGGFVGGGNQIFIPRETEGMELLKEELLKK